MQKFTIPLLLQGIYGQKKKGQTGEERILNDFWGSMPKEKKWTLLLSSSKITITAAIIYHLKEDARILANLKNKLSKSIQSLKRWQSLNFSYLVHRRQPTCPRHDRKWTGLWLMHDFMSIDTKRKNRFLFFLSVHCSPNQRKKGKYVK